MMEDLIRGRLTDKLLTKDVPAIAVALETIAVEMKKANELKEQEIDLLRQIHKIGPEYR